MENPLDLRSKGLLNELGGQRVEQLIMGVFYCENFKLIFETIKTQAGLSY